MSRISLFIFFLTLFNWKISAQDNIQFNQLDINEIEISESEIGSTFTDSTKLSLPRNPLVDSLGKIETTGLIFTRPNEDFPLKLNVWYLFEDRNLTTSAIKYNWGLYNPSFDANKNRDLLVELTQQESQFLNLFEHLYKLILGKFGKPDKHLINIDKPHRLVQNYVWSSKNTIIQLELDFSRQIQEFPGIGLQTNNFEISLITRENAM